jgi:drug/metabolite transporter (DMT)-like permease
MTASESIALEAARLATADRTRALAALTLTALIWGFTTTIVRALTQAISPADLLVIRATISGVLMVALLTVWDGWRVAPRDLPRLIACGLLGVTGYYLLSTYGMQTTPASLAGLMLGTEPLFIAIFAALLLGEPIRPVTAIGLALAATGTAFLVLSPGHHTVTAGNWTLFGPLLVLISGAIWSLSAVLSKPLLHTYGPSRVTLLNNLIGLAPLLALGSPQTLETVRTMTPWLWLLILILATISSILSLQLWSYGLKHIASANAAAFIYVVPLVSVAAGVLLLGEPLTLPLIAGGVLIMAGVLVAQLKRR